jgi:hypothetical protein
MFLSLKIFLIVTLPQYKHNAHRKCGHRKRKKDIDFVILKAKAAVIPQLSKPLLDELKLKNIEACSAVMFLQ